MTRETVLRNAEIVLDDEIVRGAVLIRDGLITDITTGPLGTGEDLEGDYLLPGLVELHTDHLESHIMPRPGTNWDPIPAVLAHDAQLTSAGATTVFDAVRIGAMAGADDASQFARAMTDAITHVSESDIARADHFIHLRCEVSAPGCAEEFDAYDDVAAVRLASLMDHTPGQRQYADVEAFRRYMVGKGRLQADQIESHIAELKQIAAVHSEPNRHAIAAKATARGIALAAHDDATLEHVEESAALGARISEFPTTELAAVGAREHGQLVVMGAPNIVRGGSQSGNVAAARLLAAGLLDILSSDYVPASPLQAVFRVVAEGVIDLPAAVRFVSANPARAVGLGDRGRIAIGLRGDLIRVHSHSGAPTGQHPAGIPVPVVRGVWRTGRRVA
ncbi:MAG: alpha-D-ribose 1-methylphosphonate 5-triphosphate diphosphatase [Actinomycetota bacterium]